MRVATAILLLLGACSESQPEREASAAAPAAAAELPTVAAASAPQTSPLMAMPEDAEALKRLQAMGYTVHEDHLHAPGVTSCPKMGDDPVM
jgi:hypothetical protein